MLGYFHVALWLESYRLGASRQPDLRGVKKYPSFYFAMKLLEWGHHARSNCRQNGEICNRFPRNSEAWKMEYVRIRNALCYNFHSLSFSTFIPSKNWKFGREKIFILLSGLMNNTHEENTQSRNSQKKRGFQFWFCEKIVSRRENGSNPYFTWKTINSRIIHNCRFIHRRWGWRAHLIFCSFSFVQRRDLSWTAVRTARIPRTITTYFN